MVWKLKQGEANRAKEKGDGYSFPSAQYCGDNCISPQMSKGIKVNACRKYSAPRPKRENGLKGICKTLLRLSQL